MNVISKLITFAVAICLFFPAYAQDTQSDDVEYAHVRNLMKGSLNPNASAADTNRDVAKVTEERNSIKSDLKKDHPDLSETDINQQADKIIIERYNK